MDTIGSGFQIYIPPPGSPDIAVLNSEDMLFEAIKSAPNGVGIIPHHEKPGLYWVWRY